VDTEPDRSSYDTNAIDPVHAARVFRPCRPLPWPATRISRLELHRLWLLGQEAGRPVTALVQEAVVEYLAGRRGDTLSPANGGEQPVQDRASRVADA
jgi:hypothetical protein